MLQYESRGQRGIVAWSVLSLVRASRVLLIGKFRFDRFRKNPITL